MTTDEQAAIATKDRLITEALAGHSIVLGGNQQLVRLWSGGFVVTTDETGRQILTTTSGKPVAEEVAARLGGDFKHFSSVPPAVLAAEAEAKVEAGAREFLMHRLAKSGANHGSFGQAQAGDHYGL